MKHLLLRTLAGEQVERPPVWAMRQAGRWDPEFNKLRGKLAFYEFSENAELSAQASLLPRRFGVDAIILFYDITTLTVAMGQKFQLLPSQGPVPDHPIRSVADVATLDARPDPERFKHVLDVLRLVKAELAGALPVLVFAGAPFTLASYCLGTGKHLDQTRSFVTEQPETWHLLRERIETATIHFLKTLASAGADAFQLFDSWAGELSREEYLQWSQPHHQSLFQAVQAMPSILFVKEGPYLDLMAQSGCAAVSLGVRHDLRAARQQYPDLVFQGNVDEELLRDGTPDQVRQATRMCLQAGEGHRHVLNLSHGVDRATPPENFAAFVEAAKSV
jgi:uroporphyrinogen decarboxylase